MENGWWSALATQDDIGYRDIADAIQDAVVEGDLAPGARLPTHRALSKSLHVAVSTVSRGYREADDRGLISSHVGRGTVVRGGVAADRSVQDGVIDLAENTLFPGAFTDDLADRIRGLAGRRDLADLFGLLPMAGQLADREVFVPWLATRGVSVPVERILLTAGAQHAMAVATSSLVPPDGKLLVGEHTCYGIHNVGRQLRVELVPAAMDEQGVRPDALGEAAAASGARVAYLMPALQNPTGRTMSAKRRRAIVEVALERGLHLIEDDAYGFLTEESALASESGAPVTFIASVGKMLWPGLRLGLLVASTPVEAARLEGAIGATVQQATGFTARLGADVMGSGLGQRIIGWKREAMVHRREIAERMIGPEHLGGDPVSPHLWLGLPEPWTDIEFVSAAAASGVRVSPGSDFAVSRSHVTRAIRVCIGSRADSGEVRRGLQAVRDLLRQPGPPPRTHGS